MSIITSDLMPVKFGSSPSLTARTFFRQQLSHYEAISQPPKKRKCFLTALGLCLRVGGMMNSVENGRSTDETRVD